MKKKLGKKQRGFKKVFTFFVLLALFEEKKHILLSAPSLSSKPLLSLSHTHTHARIPPPGHSAPGVSLVGFGGKKRKTRERGKSVE